MCLLLFYINPDAGSDDLYLVLVNVRDEVYNRPTKLAQFWENYPQVIGGRDDEPGREGGTWLAMSQSGRIGALLNILQPDEDILSWKKGRGFLAADYVTGEKDHLVYLKEVKEDAEKYNSFLVVTMDCSSLKEPKAAYYTNSSPGSPIQLSPGIHAFGNSITPNTPWPKISSAKENFSKIVQKYPKVSTKNALVEEIFSLLQDRTRHELDDSMKKQGSSKTDEFLSKLGAVFVHIPEFNYGSRCHTIIIIDGIGSVDYYEKSRPETLAPEAEENWILNHHLFELHKGN